MGISHMLGGAIVPLDVVFIKFYSLVDTTEEIRDTLMMSSFMILVSNRTRVSHIILACMWCL